MAAKEQFLNTSAEARDLTHCARSQMQVVQAICGDRGHIISGCSKLARTDYTKRHSNVTSIVYRAIGAEYNLEHSKDWWIEPEKVVRNYHAKILWDFPIQTDKHPLHNRSDIM